MPSLQDLLRGQGSSGIPAQIDLPSVSQAKESSSNSSFPRGEFLSGGVLSKIGDILSIPSYGLGGFLQGSRQKAEEFATKTPKGSTPLATFGPSSLFDTLLSGVKNIPKGISQRTSPSAYLRETFPNTLASNPAVGFATDVISDPMNYLTGPIGKGFSKIGEFVGPKISPVVDKFTLGRNLNPAEAERAAQITKGGITAGDATVPLSKIEQTANEINLTKNLTKIDEVISAVKKGAYNTAKMLTNDLPAGVKDQVVSVINDFGKSVSKAATERFGPAQVGTKLLPATTDIGERANQALTAIKSFRTNLSDADRKIFNSIVEAATKGNTQVVKQYIVELSPKVQKKASNLTEDIINTIEGLRLRKGKNIEKGIKTGEGFVMGSNKVARIGAVEQAVKKLNDIKNSIASVDTGVSSVFKKSNPSASIIDQSLKTPGQRVIEKVTENPTIKRVATTLSEKLPESFRIQKGLVEAAKKSGIELSQAVGKQLTEGFTQDMQQVMGKIMQGLPVNEVIAKSTFGAEKYAEMQTAVGIARRNLDSLSKELAAELVRGGLSHDEGLVSKILENVGTYLPRQYRKWLDNPEELAQFFTSGDKQKLILDLLKKRADIPKDVRESMGQILEPGFPAAKAIKDISNNVAVSKLFRWVNKNFAHTKNATGELVQLTGKRFGVLDGKWIPSAMAKDIKGTLGIKPEGLAGSIQNMYQKFLSAWKFSKVVLNPATQARNFMSNLILMDMGGFPIFSPESVKHFSNAIREYTSKGAEFQMAKKLNLLSGTYTKSELEPFLNAFSDEMAKGSNPMVSFFKNLTSKGTGIAANSYRTIEETSKLAMYMWRRSAGDKPLDAARYAQKWLFDYADIPEGIKYLRDAPLGFPFITFAYKSIPRFAEVAAKNPTAISKYYKAFANIEQETRAKEDAALPDYIQKGLYVKLPWNDKNGRAQYLDMNYILPWANITDYAGGNAFLPSNPIFSIPADIQRNVSAFTQKPIWLETDTDQEKSIKVSDYIYKAIMPSLAPEIPFTGIRGGYSWDKLVSSLTQKPDYFGRIKSLPSTFLDIGLGIKAQPFDIGQEVGFRSMEQQKKSDEIKANIRKIGRDQSMSDEEKQKKIESQVKKLENINTEFQKRFSNFGPDLGP